MIIYVFAGILKQKGNREASPKHEAAEEAPKEEKNEEVKKPESPVKETTEVVNKTPEVKEVKNKKGMLIKGKSREGDTGEEGSNGNSSKVRFTENGVAVEKKEGKSGSKGSKGNSKVLRRKNTPARLPKMQRMQGTCIYSLTTYYQLLAPINKGNSETLSQQKGALFISKGAYGVDCVCIVYRHTIA